MRFYTTASKNVNIYIPISQKRWKLRNQIRDHWKRSLRLICSICLGPIVGTWYINGLWYIYACHCLSFVHVPAHDKTNKMVFARSEDSDQPGHPLISVFAVRLVGSKGTKLSSCGQRRLCSDWADARAYLSLRWTHMPFGFVMRSLIWYWSFLEFINEWLSSYK